VCSVERGRDKLDAVATIAAPSELGHGEIGVLRETVVVTVGERHLPHLDRIVDPLVVTDLITAVWSPHGHPDAVDSLRSLSQVVLLDTVDEPELGPAIRRARELSQDLYVVDLAWLRSTPWRERIAATFDPEPLRPDLQTISLVEIRHHPESAAAGLLLIGWMASRLGWRTSPLVRRDSILSGSAHGRRQDVRLRLRPEPRLQVRGLEGLTLETASGRHFDLDRGPGGLHARYVHRRGTEREWTILGASRGEPGILGEGIRQALLRDPTYGPALGAAETLLP
jgi:glucose-6-phosphate dehydrogenase assembly protein OpcA